MKRSPVHTVVNVPAINDLSCQHIKREETALLSNGNVQVVEFRRVTGSGSVRQ